MEHPLPQKLLLFPTFLVFSELHSLKRHLQFPVPEGLVLSLCDRSEGEHPTRGH